MGKLLKYYIIISIVIGIICGQANGEIYKCINEFGKTTFQENPCKIDSKLSEKMDIKITRFLQPAKINKTNIENHSLALSQSASGNDVLHGIEIRDSNPEFGKKIPKELCTKTKRHPCGLPINLLYNVVADINSTREHLSQPAYTALKPYSVGTLVWEFNLCKNLWDNDIHCSEVLGYLAVKNNDVKFYTFQKPRKIF